MNARYYEGSRGQFLSQDPAFLAVGNAGDLKSKTGLDLQTYLSDPQGFNSYSYARNNPLKYVDQDGNFWQIPVAMAVIYAPQILSFTQSLLTPLGQIGVSQAIDDARSGNYGMAVIGGLTAGEIPAGAGKYIPTFDGLWTVGKGASRADNALYHAFQAGDQGLGHAQEFGLSSAKDYVTATRNFITNAINKGYMTKLESGKNFDILRTYDQGSDTFSVFEVNRSTNAITPRTMFTPDPAVHGKGTNLNYFNSQAGKAINIKKYFGK